ncbi:hypothetical protein JCM11641_008048 [Rhodosporidiobolus odoratus]
MTEAGRPPILKWGVWGIISAAAILRRRGGDLPAKVDSIYLVLAILYCICSGLEAFGFFAAWRSSIKLVRSYFWASASIALIVTAGELMRTVVHFTDKSAIIDACKKSFTEDVANGNYTQSAVDAACSDNWRSQSYVDIGLLLFSFFISFFFASLAASYLHQLQNPHLLRTQAPPQNAAASNQYAYPLQPYGPTGAPMYPHVAPYGVGPPPPGYGPGTSLPGYDNPYGTQVSDDKSPGAGAGGGGVYPAPASNPFEDSVQHLPQHQQQQQQHTLQRREGEAAEEFELRQHEHDLEQERRRGMGMGESTETVTLGGRAGEGRV